MCCCSQLQRRKSQCLNEESELLRHLLNGNVFKYYLHKYYRYFQYITLKLINASRHYQMLMKESVELKLKTKKHNGE